jgi:hypothetical protein
LHARHAGQGLRAGYVKGDCYRAMLGERGWQPQPWDGRHGVGKYLTRLMGGRRRSGYVTEASGGKRRVRGYFIPRVIEVRGRQAS